MGALSTRPGNESLFAHCEPIDRLATVPVAGIENRAREVRLIRRIWEVLRLETEGGAEGIDRAALANVARRLAFEEIARVELNAGFRGPHFHHPARARLVDPRSETQLVPSLVEHII